jgi:hypothetical protein
MPLFGTTTLFFASACCDSPSDDVVTRRYGVAVNGKVAQAPHEAPFFPRRRRVGEEGETVMTFMTFMTLGYLDKS